MYLATRFVYYIFIVPVFKPRGSRFGVLYGICKTRKKVLYKCPPLRPILSAIKIPSYNLGKFLVPFIEHITKNNFTVKNNFEFSKEICEQNPEYFMASLDVESLFTNKVIVFHFWLKYKMNN